MQCFKCIEHMMNGNLKDLKEVRSHCDLYQNNQCPHMAVEGSFTASVQDANVSLFPEKLKELFSTLIIPVLVLAVFATSFLFWGVKSNPIWVEAATDFTSVYQQSIENAERMGSDVEAFKYLSAVYVSDQGSFTSVELQGLKQYLLRLGENASFVKPSEVYSKIGVDESSPLFIFKVQGYVSRIIRDIYSGDIAIVSDTTEFEAKSLHVMLSDSRDVYEGSEVVFLCVPKFVNIATPLTVYGWVQP